MTFEEVYESFKQAGLDGQLYVESSMVSCADANCYHCKYRTDYSHWCHNNAPYRRELEEKLQKEFPELWV